MDQEGLKLSFRSITLKEKDSPSYVCVRQQHHGFKASVVFLPENLTGGRRAGMALVQNNEFHLRVEACRVKAGIEASVILCEGGKDRVWEKRLLPGSTGETKEGIRLTLEVSGLEASVEYETAESGLLCSHISIKSLSTETAGGFVGCTVGMYAVAESDSSQQAACFKSFAYMAV